MKKFISAFAAFAILFFLLQTPGKAETFQSSARRISLLELYSSEGCSSCPPADAWVSRQKSEAGLWKTFIPVIFHVDYWDGLGWKDRFSLPEYTQRQRDYTRAWRGSTLYTPGVVLNGQAWDQWRRAQHVPASSEQPGILKIERLQGSQFQVMFDPASDLKKFNGYAVLLGFGVDSAVERGENGGRKLRHDFIVLDYKRFALTAKVSSAPFELMSSQDLKPLQLGVAVWITSLNDLLPIQAAGGYLN